MRKAKAGSTAEIWLAISHVGTSTFMVTSYLDGLSFSTQVSLFEDKLHIKHLTYIFFKTDLKVEQLVSRSLLTYIVS